MGRESRVAMQQKIASLEADIVRLVEENRLLTAARKGAQQTLHDMSIDLAHLANMLSQQQPINMEVLREVQFERARQDAKWGEQNHDDGFWLAILGEEYGEACQAMLQQKDSDRADLEQELVQVAAVAVAWLQCIRRRKAQAEQPAEVAPEWNNY